MCRRKASKYFSASSNAEQPARLELPQCDGVRMVGKILGEPHQTVRIGAPARVVFEHHAEEDPAFTLVQRRLV